MSHNQIYELNIILDGKFLISNFFVFFKVDAFYSFPFEFGKIQIFTVHGEKIFAGLANRIVDMKPTNFFAVPAKF